MLFDTDVLIWNFRGDRKAAERIEAADVKALSVVSYIELIQGARSRPEIRLIQEFLRDFSFETLPVTEKISQRAVVYVEEYGLSVQMGLADALIAATAVENGKTLLTGNARHFRVIKDLRLEAFRSSR